MICNQSTISECELTRYSGATLHSDDIHVILLSRPPPPSPYVKRLRESHKTKFR